MSSMMLAADAAMNAIADCGIDKNEIDGVALRRQQPDARWRTTSASRRSTSTARRSAARSFILHVRHAAAALALGYCNVRPGHAWARAATPAPTTRAAAGRRRRRRRRCQLDFGAQFEAPYGAFGPDHAVRDGRPPLHEGDRPHARAAGVGRRRPAQVGRTGNPRAMMRDLSHGRRRHGEPDGLLSDAPARVLPGHRRRRRDHPDDGRPRQGLPDEARLHPRAPASRSETPMVSRWRTSRRRRPSGSPAPRPSTRRRITHADVDHMMVYDAFAHLPIYALEDTRLRRPRRGGRLHRRGQHAPGGKLPLNTNGGGLCYTHTGMYGMFADAGVGAPAARRGAGTRYRT